MPLRHFSPKLSAEAREAISAAFDAMTTFHAETASSSDKVVAKMGDAARALGWPEPIISGITMQIQSVTKMQIQMIAHLMDACEAQLNSPNPMAHLPSEMLSKLQSWPGLFPSGGWPDTVAFNGMPVDPVKFWMHLGEQWQKNWAQSMNQWSGSR